MSVRDATLDTRRVAFRHFLAAVRDLPLEEGQFRPLTSPRFIEAVLEGVREVGSAEIGHAVLGYGKEFTSTPAGLAALRLSFDLTEEVPDKAVGFIDVETLDEETFVVYYDTMLKEGTEQGIEKFLSKYGEVVPLTVPGDTIFENVSSNIYVFLIYPKEVVREDHATVRVMARKSAKAFGANPQLVRKAILRAIAQKGFINHNVYRAGGIPSHVKAWEKFVGAKNPSKGKR